MKIRLWDRAILFFGALLALLAGLFLILCGLLVLEGSEHAHLRQVLSLVLGGLSVGLGAALFALSRRFSNRRHAFVVQQTDNGELRIAVNAIENLVQKCIDMHEEMHVNDMKIRHSREGVTVDLSISLANNISIPLAVASLQKQIKQYLVASSGIDVKEVRVSVESTQTGVGDSPYLVSSESAEQPSAQVETTAKEKKIPLHRRLFCKAEQAATVPEPPKADQEEVPAEDQAADPCDAEPIDAQEDQAIPEETIAAADEVPQTEEQPAPAQEETEQEEKEEESLG